MNAFLILLPLAGVVVLLALAAAFWALRSGQYDDPEGDAARILRDED